MKLPYDYDALAPVLSAETLKFHHDKHHRGYVDKLNELMNPKLSDSHAAEATALKDLVLSAGGEIYNNAAQIWNHDFYWNSVSPTARSIPAGALAKAIDTKFKSFSAFEDSFIDSAKKLFGSGWLWLTVDKAGAFGLFPGSNADNPLRRGMTPLLVCDVWEHAYYIDYRHEREKYLDGFWSLVDWPVVAKRFAEIDEEVAAPAVERRRAKS
ncbi:MAG: superoxide dismutase [Gammaproteobacteria bacterium]